MDEQKNLKKKCIYNAFKFYSYPHVVTSILFLLTLFPTIRLFLQVSDIGNLYSGIEYLILSILYVFMLITEWMSFIEMRSIYSKDFFSFISGSQIRDFYLLGRHYEIYENVNGSKHITKYGSTGALQIVINFFKEIYDIFSWPVYFLITAIKIKKNDVKQIEYFNNMQFSEFSNRFKNIKKDFKILSKCKFTVAFTCIAMVMNLTSTFSLIDIGVNCQLDKIQMNVVKFAKNIEEHGSSFSFTLKIKNNNYKKLDSIKGIIKVNDAETKQEISNISTNINLNLDKKTEKNIDIIFKVASNNDLLDYFGSHSLNDFDLYFECTDALFGMIEIKDTYYNNLGYVVKI